MTNPNTAALSLREALTAIVKDQWGLEPSTNWDGCYTANPLERMARAALSAAPPEALAEGSWASRWLTNGAELHPQTVNLVVRFARALAAKLAKAEEKYGYTDGWRNDDWLDKCRTSLREHVAKGDPRDVAAYCAFLWHHGASTAEPEATSLSSHRKPEEALAEQQAQARDAERYQWLRNRGLLFGSECTEGLCIDLWSADGGGEQLSGERADAAIDAAIAQENPS